MGIAEIFLSHGKKDLINLYYIKLSFFFFSLHIFSIVLYIVFHRANAKYE